MTFRCFCLLSINIQCDCREHVGTVATTSHGSRRRGIFIQGLVGTRKRTFVARCYSSDRSRCIVHLFITPSTPVPPQSNTVAPFTRVQRLEHCRVSAPALDKIRGGREPDQTMLCGAGTDWRRAWNMRALRQHEEHIATRWRPDGGHIAAIWSFAICSPYGGHVATRWPQGVCRPDGGHMVAM